MVLMPLLVITAALAAGPAAAPAADGLHLQRMCNGQPGTYPHAACLYYVTGFADGALAATSHMHQLGRPLACIPRDVAGEEVRAATLTSLRLHPERRRSAMNAVVLMALAEAWPCPPPRR